MIYPNSALSSVIIDFPCIAEMVDQYFQDTYPELALKPMDDFESFCKKECFSFKTVASMTANGYAFDNWPDGYDDSQPFDTEAPYFVVDVDRFVSLKDENLACYYGREDSIELQLWAISHLDLVSDEAKEAVMAWTSCYLYVPKGEEDRATFNKFPSPAALAEMGVPERFHDPKKNISRYCRSRLEPVLLKINENDYLPWSCAFASAWGLHMTRLHNNAFTFPDGSTLSSLSSEF